MDEQIKRIEGMEKRLDRASKRVHALRRALSGYARCVPEIRELIDYYESPLWRMDYQADEDGLIPADLKRGVLSEDGIFDLLTDLAALDEEIKQMKHPEQDR